MRRIIPKRKERGTTIMEMSIAGSVVFLAIFSVIEFGRLLLTQNALTDAARRGARYAALNKKNVAKVQNVAVYGDPDGGSISLVNGLTTDNVDVVYTSDFGVHQGAVTVTITKYNFSFIVPLIGATIGLGEFKTTLPAEAAGVKPPTLE